MEKVQKKVFQNDGSVVIAEKIGNVALNNNRVTSPAKEDNIIFGVLNPDINFVGRSLELGRLKDTMEHENSPDLSTPKANIIIVSGLGGIGKTQLVIKFIKQNRLLYKNVIWINSASPQSIEESFIALAEVMNIATTNADGSKKDFKSVVQIVLNKLSKRKTLIAYDNVDNIEDINVIIIMETLGEKPHVIITTRIQEWGDEIDVIHLKVWELDDAIKYVSLTLNDPNDLEADKKLLVERLQFFPLALRQATAHIRYQRKYRRNFQITDYISKYDTPEMLGSKLFQKNLWNHYEQTTYTTWRITIDTIKKDSVSGALAVKILNIIAYFDPNNIYRDIFVYLQNEPDELQSPNDNDYEENVRSAVRLLVNYSMVDDYEYQNVLSIHRLVQKVIKLRLHETQQEEETLKIGLILIRKLIEHKDVNIYKAYSHTISVFLSALKFNKLMHEFSGLLPKILESLLHNGKDNRAGEFGEQVLQTLTQILDEGHEDILASRLYMRNMKIDFAEVIKEVLEKQIMTLEDDNINTLYSKFRLGLCYSRWSMYNEALQTYEEVFDKQKALLGEDHEHTRETKRSIAHIHHTKGNYNKALQMFEETFEKAKNNLGEYDMFMLNIQLKIGDSYNKLGKYADALQTFEQLYEKYTITFGEDHRRTLILKRNIAFSHFYAGKYKKAFDIFKELLEKQKQILGEDFVDTLYTKQIIAGFHRDLGMYTEVHQNLLDIFEKQKFGLGDDHLDTLKTRHSIACSYIDQGMYKEALQIHKEVIETRKKLLGEEDFKIRCSMASIYIKMGKHSDALQICQEVLDKQKKVLGYDHPGTLLTRYYLAASYSGLGNYTEALKIFEEVYEKQENILGEDHPDALLTRYNIAFLYKELGKYTEALSILEIVFVKQKNVLGENHRDTIITGHSIANCSTKVIEMADQAVSIHDTDVLFFF